MNYFSFSTASDFALPVNIPIAAVAQLNTLCVGVFSTNASRSKSALRSFIFSEMYPDIHFFTSPTTSTKNTC